MSTNRADEAAARERVLSWLRWDREDDQELVGAREICDETGLDLGAVEAAMGTLERAGPFEIRREVRDGRLGWRVET